MIALALILTASIYFIHNKNQFTNMYLAGTGKGDITAFKKGAGMLGYGIHYNTMEEIETALSARAFIFVDKKTARKICFVNCELGLSPLH